MFMMRLVYGCLFVYATSFAAETQFVPLIPRNLESWSELKAELAAHVSALDSNDDISAYVGTIPWGTDFSRRI